MAQTVKNLPAVQETRVLSLDWKDPLEKEMATHSSILAWRIPWNLGNPGGLQSKGLQRVGHNLVSKQQQPLEGPARAMEDPVSQDLLFLCFSREARNSVYYVKSPDS